MSTRGTNFFHQWLPNNLPETVGGDTTSASELTHKLFADAKALGIGSFEIEEDAGSACEVILGAIVHLDDGLANWAQGDQTQ